MEILFGFLKLFLNRVQRLERDLLACRAKNKRYQRKIERLTHQIHELEQKLKVKQKSKKHDFF